MNSFALDPEEQELLAAFEAGEMQSDFSEERKAELGQMAEASLKKDKRINIRISSRDLQALQQKAMEEGMPYQTLVSSILHKYASGSLYDLSAQHPTPQDIIKALKLHQR